MIGDGEFLNSAMNFMSDPAVNLSISKARTRRYGILKGLSHERGRVKSAKILCAFPIRGAYHLRHISVKLTSSDSPFKYISCNIHAHNLSQIQEKFLLGGGTPQKSHFFLDCSVN